MNNVWSTVLLGAVIAHRKEFIQIDDLAEYKRCRVQLHTRGVVPRDIVEGAAIKTKSQQICRAGEFLVAEIDAKVGGFGIVPDDLDGAIVSSHYFLFTIDETRLDRGFLGYFVCTPAFREQVGARGSTNYAAIRPSHVLNYEVPLPPLEEQRRIVAKIDQLAAKIDEARGLRLEADAEVTALRDTALRSFFLSGLAAVWPRESIETLCVHGPQNGLFKTKDFFGAGTRLLNVADAYKALDVLVEQLDRVEVTEHEGEQFGLNTGDVCIVRSSIKDEGIGRTCVFPGADEPVVFECHLMRLRLDPHRVEPRLFAMFFNNSLGKEQILSSRRAAVLTTINQRDIRALTFPVAPLDVQRRIVAYLDSLQAKVDRLKALQEKTAAELDALLPAILDKAFKGEL